MRVYFIADLSTDFLKKERFFKPLDKKSLVEYVSNLNKPLFKVYAKQDSIDIIKEELDMPIKLHNNENTYKNGEWLLYAYEVEDL